MTKPTVRAEVEMECRFIISPSDTWGPECTIQQVQDLARRAAMSKLHKLLSSAEADNRIRTPQQHQVIEIRIVNVKEVT